MRLDGYVDAWRSEDTQGVERRFTEDARYRRSPDEKSDVGHDAIKAFWLADAGETFAVKTSRSQSMVRPVRSQRGVIIRFAVESPDQARRNTAR